MVRDPSIVSPSLTGVFIGGGGVITNTVPGSRCTLLKQCRPPSPSSPWELGDVGGDGGVTDRAPSRARGGVPPLGDTQSAERTKTLGETRVLLVTLDGPFPSNAHPLRARAFLLVARPRASGPLGALRLAPRPWVSGYQPAECSLHSKKVKRECSLQDINILIKAARVADDMAPRAVKNHTRVC